MPQPVKFGRKTRMSFSKINEVAEMPNLIQIQTDSYDWFVKEGIREVFDDISPIKDYAGNLILEFIDYSLSDPPKYEQEECKERDVTYAAPLKVKVRLVNKETGEVKEQEVFMGDFPLMTEKGTFIYNGAERVVVTQLVRSPGPYYDVTVDKSNNRLYSTQIIPNRGAWLEYETDSNEIISVRVDRTRKQPVTTLLRALGFGTDQEILDIFGDDVRLKKTLEKDSTDNYEDGLKEIYKKLRPGEPPTVESAKSLLDSLFFDPKRYDLAKVGRYKYNKKLGISNRITGVVSAEDVFDPNTGEILVSKDEKISRDTALAISLRSVVKDSITAGPSYLTSSRASLMPFQSKWSSPGVPLSFAQAWKSYIRLPAARIAAGRDFSSIFMWNVSSRKPILLQPVFAISSRPWSTVFMKSVSKRLRGSRASLTPLSPA